MTRRKKTRNPGQLAPRSEPKAERQRDEEHHGKRTDYRKGHAPGSRHNPAEGKNTQGGPQNPAAQDPRHGSKKPVPLFVSEKKTTEKPSVPDSLTPEQELEQLENDELLQDLLEKTERGHALTPSDQAYMNKKMARFQQLAEQLGLDASEGDPETESERSEGDDWFDGSSLDEWRKE